MLCFVVFDVFYKPCTWYSIICTEYRKQIKTNCNSVYTAKKNCVPFIFNSKYTQICKYTQQA